jgi:acetolactate synthase-1/2/3 large subunit
MITVAELLAQTLAEAGIEVVFGLPGGENAEVLDALRREGLRFVLVRNESSAVFMADATARLTGKPGVCLATLGPGAANAFVGVAHAYLDRAPVLLITAQSIGRLLDHHTHQVLDLQAIFAPVTKMSRELTSVGTGRIVREALDLTMAGRPGPVHLGISSETAGQPVEADTPLVLEPIIEPVDFNPALFEAREMLAQARRPIIVTGLGLEPEGPYQALADLAGAAQAPVLVTPKGKGNLPDDHPLAGGTIGLTRIDPAYELLDEADCIVAVGFDVVELVKPWEQKAPLIWLAPWPNEDPKIAAEFEFVGPMTPALQQLTDATFAPAAGWGAARVAAFRQKLANPILPTPTPGRMLPQAVLQAVRANTPPDILLTTDVGSHKIFTALNWPAYAPNRYLVSNGLSAMSFGLPAAIAASMTLNRPVVCLTGDGGLAMVLGELGLLAERQLPVVLVVMNDSALDLIRAGQLRAGKAAFGTEFTNPDFARIAQGFGLDFYRVASEAECAQAVQAAFAAGRPTFIEAMIDPASYPTAPGYVAEK